MSVIGRKPFINKIVDACDKTKVSTIVSLLDNLGSATHVSLKTLSDSNKGVSHVIFNLNELQNKNVEGILVYVDNDNCGLLSFDSVSGNMFEFQINPTEKNFVQLYEHLTVEELRQICGDRIATIWETNGVTEQELQTALEGKANIYTVNDIKNLSQDFLNNLKTGDIIREDGYAYIVGYKDDSKIDLVGNDGYSDLKTIIYDYTDEQWVCNENTYSIPLSPLLTDVDKANKLLGFNNNGALVVVDKPTNPLLSDCVVQISTDNGTTYGSGMSLSEFIAKCEHGDYASNVGAIARITKLINGQTMRIRLIGVNHDVLANTDAGELEPSGTAAKTTWQFYDMPVQKVNLGLPYDAQDFDTVADFVAGDDYYSYPSNKHGYSSATGLLDALHCIFESLPLTLQKSMKLVRKDCYIPRINHSDDIDDVRDNSTADFIRAENDRYGSCVSQKLFCLSAAEIGATDSTNWPLTVTINEGEEGEQEINLEGHKYAYFETGNEGTTLTKRIRYYGGDAYYYWLRSPGLLGSGVWGFVTSGGSVSVSVTYINRGLAPAFCI